MCANKVQLVSLHYLSSSEGMGRMMMDIGVKGCTAPVAKFHDDMPALAAAVAAPIRKLWVLKRDRLKPSNLRWKR